MYQAETTLYVSSPNHSDYNTVVGDQQAAKAFALFPQSSSILPELRNVYGFPSSTPRQGRLIETGEVEKTKPGLGESKKKGAKARGLLVRCR